MNPAGARCRCTRVRTSGFMLARFAVVLALSSFLALSSCAPAAGRPASADGAPTPLVASAPAASSAPAPASSPATAPARPALERSPRYSFHGNKAVSADDLRAVVLLDKPGLPAGVSNEDVLERDVLMITALYYDRGYLLVKVQPPVLAAATDGPFIDVRFRIDEGPRFRIGKLTIDERDDQGRVITPLGGKELRARISVPDGAWFSRAALVGDLGSIRTAYRDAGYASVEADPITELDPAQGRVDVAITVRRHALTTLHAIVVAGNRRTSTADVMKHVLVSAGQLFNETKLEKTRAILLATGAFREVAISTQATPSASRITVTIEVTER